MTLIWCHLWFEVSESYNTCISQTKSYSFCKACKSEAISAKYKYSVIWTQTKEIANTKNSYKIRPLIASTLAGSINTAFWNNISIYTKFFLPLLLQEELNFHCINICSYRAHGKPQPNGPWAHVHSSNILYGWKNSIHHPIESGENIYRFGRHY